MINLINEIPKEELETLDAWRCADIEIASAIQLGYDIAPIEQVLRVWNLEKQNLFKLLGNNLIISKQVSLAKDAKFLFNELDEYLKENPLKTRIKELCLANQITYQPSESIYINSAMVPVNALFDAEDLLDNRLKHNWGTFTFTKNNHNVKLQKDTKPLRVLNKIANEFPELKDLYEVFRLKHSQILNDKNLTGELCLSIHPLDYLTMSNNANNWTSCMRWGEDIGGYRGGTVEMMNSSIVVEAYLKSNVDMPMPQGKTWNNKKWRQLFIVSKECILGIKGYPFHSKVLEKYAINWLKDLAKENLGWDYKKLQYIDMDNCSHVFTSNIMYNDIYGNSIGFCQGANAPRVIRLNYSGPNTCMICGREYDPQSEYDRFDEASQVITCPNCAPYIPCEHCGSLILPEQLVKKEGHTICIYCYDNLPEDFITGEKLWNIENHKEAESFKISYQGHFNYLYTVNILYSLIDEGKIVDDISKIKKLVIQDDLFQDTYLTIAYEDLTPFAQAKLNEYFEKVNISLKSETHIFGNTYQVKELSIPYKEFMSTSIYIRRKVEK